jgi:hypothetical protein
MPANKEQFNYVGIASGKWYGPSSDPVQVDGFKMPPEVYQSIIHPLPDSTEIFPVTTITGTGQVIYPTSGMETLDYPRSVNFTPSTNNQVTLDIYGWDGYGTYVQHNVNAIYTGLGAPRDSARAFYKIEKFVVTGAAGANTIKCNLTRFFGLMAPIRRVNGGSGSLTHCEFYDESGVDPVGYSGFGAVATYNDIRGMFYTGATYVPAITGSYYISYWTSDTTSIL